MKPKKFQNINTQSPEKDLLTFNLQEKEILNLITSTISEFTKINIIVFNEDLNILYFTPHISSILDICDSIDKTLLSGTEEIEENHWTQIFHSILRSGKKSEFRDIRYKKNAREYRLTLTCIPLNRSDQQSPEGGILIIQNALDHSSIEDYPFHTERLIALGKIAARVAHELNNPLDGILRYINLSIRILDEGQLEKTREYLQQCRTGLRRMIQILSELLEFSRNTHLTFEKLPLDRLLADAIKALEHPLKGIQVTIDRQYKGATPCIRADSMFQVFCNLIKNAAEAMNGTGSLTISIHRFDSTWTLSFRDTGPGFDPAHTESLFQPFYTTKPYGRGTGLGLAICKDILEKYGGTISAVNAPEGGGIFKITLPIGDNLNPPFKEPVYDQGNDSDR